MQAPSRIVQAAQQRIEAAQEAIKKSMDMIEQGTPLEAEPDPKRKAAYVAARVGVNLETAKRIINNDDPTKLGLKGESLYRAEAIQGKTVDYIGVAWLEAGRVASNAVARIIFQDGGPQGTGFLVSDRLLLTNNHVIPNKATANTMYVEFHYEIKLGENTPQPIRFKLDPNTFFETDSTDDLDYTLIAIGDAVSGNPSLAQFGRCPLSASSAKHAVGAPVNIIQHPDGDYKQIVIRENRIIHRGDKVLHYIADTEPGASGSPVFNDDWHVVALHHWGSPHRETSANGQPLSTDVNEGIRISAIVAELQARMPNIPLAKRQLLQAALAAPQPGNFGTRVVQINGEGQHGIFVAPASAPANDEDTTSVNERAEAGGAPASLIDRNYDNRRGYNEQFLPGFLVPMPQLNADQRAVAARVSGVGDAANPYELKYQHFSIVVNASRRMPFFTICNIDGSKKIQLKRDGTVKRGPEGAEASETWAIDPRIPASAQLSDGFYDRMRRSLGIRQGNNYSEFLARGHMTRREDPNWGTIPLAQRANNDTFHHTNGCPQVQNAFNGSNNAWLGIEDYVLNNTDDSNLRVTVITGPVFTDEDPVFQDSQMGAVQLPKRFWKIVARVEDGEPKVFALLADQSEALDALYEARRRRGGGEAAEALWDWPNRLSTEFISTVAEVAQATGLDFGDLATHDIFANGPESGRVVRSPEILFPRRVSNVSNGFGQFASIGTFLEEWESRLRAAPAEETEGDGAERRRRPRTQPRARKVAEIEAKVGRLFSDDLSGAKHQQFTVIPTKWVGGDATAKADVQGLIADEAEIRLAVRFGDSRGLADRIPGLRRDTVLHIKGEWIAAADAYSIGGERLPVLHFTHDPLGFICTEIRCFS